MIFRARQFTVRFPRPTLVMGIVNVTPDSFSDGGRFFAPEAAVGHGLDLVAQGAEILDVGGESTRPGAEPVAEAEELRRVLPVIAALAGRVAVPISIDTVKPAVARAALAAGASIVNDTAGHRAERGMWQVVAESGAGYVCMHMQGAPPTMQLQPAYADVGGEVAGFFAERLERLAQAGVGPEHVALDPGIGFGKTAGHNLQLLGHLEHLTKFVRPVVLGLSRKSFIGQSVGAQVQERLPGSLACACWAVQHGVQILRAHDVAATVQAIRMTEKLVAYKARCGQP